MIGVLTLVFTVENAGTGNILSVIELGSVAVGGYVVHVCYLVCLIGVRESETSF